MWYILLAVVILIFICIFIANSAPNHFKNTYKKISNYVLNADYTAGDFAIDIANSKDVKGLRLGKIEGKLTDCFNHKLNMIGLTESTINSHSIADFAIVAHEAGHAIQHNRGYVRYKLSIVLGYISIVLGKLIFPLLLAGGILLALNVQPIGIGYGMCIGGVCLLVLSLLFKLITIPIEYQASNIGLQLLVEHNVLDKKGIRLAKKVLRAAGMTYIGAFFSSMLYWTFLVPKYK